MSSRETLNKRETLFKHYTRLKGETHVLRKLVEEQAELSQVIMKILDKAENKEEITLELLSTFWEEMAHSLLFWGIANDFMKGHHIFTEHYTERYNRLITKISEKMSDIKYPARVILHDPPLTAPVTQLPYETLEDGTIVCYLTQEQYDAQMSNINSTWVDINNNPADFDDGYWERTNVA